MSVTTETTDIRGGLGNKICYRISSSRTLELTVDSSTFQQDYLPMILGGDVEESVTSEVQAGGTVKVVDNAGTMEVTLPTSQAAVTTIILEDKKGVQIPVVGTAGVFAVPTAGFEATEGDELQYFYKKSITGSKYTLDAAKFASKIKLTMRTLCYDVETEAVYSDLWWEFPSVSSTGNLDLTMTAGEALVPSMTFVATSPNGETALGYKYEQLRA